MSLIKYKNFFLAFLFIFFGIVFRIFLNKQFHIPNFEAVTAIALLSGVFFKGIYSVLIPLNIMFFSDLYFGNSAIYLFTWSAFILVGLFGNILNRDSRNYTFKLMGLGVLSVLFFYAWTNFGWWLISGMYPISLQGLVQCYLMAIPFLRNQLLSAFIFIPGLNLIFSFLFDKIFLVLAKENKFKLIKIK